MTDTKKEIQEAVLSVVEASLAAQLKAVRQLRADLEKPKPQAQKSMSQMEMVHDILLSSKGPLHIREIIQHLQDRFGVTVDRESLVSALSKKVRRGDRFQRTAKNTFGLLEV